jgi:ABC-2 type transport system ATP-binding protein
VIQDAAGDPRVGISGPSYGGALALLAAGYDDRVDAIVPQITWNSMVSAFFPNSVGSPVAATPAAGSPASDDGVFKQLWAGLFFSSGSALDPAAILAAQNGGGGLPDGVTNPVCGRFRPEVCAAYADAATTGRLSPETAAVLERSSPASVLDRITAPTLLIQGEADTLFTLSEADANARGIAASGTPVKVVWYTGGHDSSGDRQRAAARTDDRVVRLPPARRRRRSGNRLRVRPGDRAVHEQRAAHLADDVDRALSRAH